MSITCTSLTFTIAAAAAGALLLNLTPTRKLLMVEVTGTNPCTFKYGSAPTSATDGFCLDPASAAGGQGGSILLTGDATPVDALYAYSTLGTTVSVTHGNPYA